MFEPFTICLNGIMKLSFNISPLSLFEKPTHSNYSSCSPCRAGVHAAERAGGLLFGNKLCPGHAHPLLRQRATRQGEKCLLKEAGLITTNVHVEFNFCTADQ